jgi:hypothetical protein
VMLRLVSQFQERKCEVIGMTHSKQSLMVLPPAPKRREQFAGSECIAGGKRHA